MRLWLISFISMENTDACKSFCALRGPSVGQRTSRGLCQESLHLSYVYNGFPKTGELQDTPFQDRFRIFALETCLRSTNC